MTQNNATTITINRDPAALGPDANADTVDVYRRDLEQHLNGLAEFRGTIINVELADRTSYLYEDAADAVSAYLREYVTTDKHERFQNRCVEVTSPPDAEDVPDETDAFCVEDIDARLRGEDR